MSEIDINRVVTGSSKLGIVRAKNMTVGQVWTREQALKAEKKGKFVYVSSDEDKVKFKSLPMTERGWKQAFDPKSKGKYPWGNNNNIFIGDVAASDLKEIYNYTGTVQSENQIIKVNIAGKEEDVISNLRKQRLLPEKKDKKKDEKFVEKFAFNSTNINTVGTYTGANTDLKSYFNKLVKEVDAMKKTDIIDIDMLVSAYVIGHNPKGLEVEILDVNGFVIGTNGDKVAAWRYPTKNLFIEKVEGIKKFSSFVNGKGGFDISGLNSAVKPKTEKGKVKYKQHKVKIVNDVEKSVERTKRQILSYRVEFFVGEKNFNIPEGKIIVGSKTSLDIFNRELTNYAKHQGLDLPKYLEERKNGKYKAVAYSDVRKSMSVRVEKEEKKPSKSKKSDKDKTEKSEKKKKSKKNEIESSEIESTGSSA